MLASQLTLVESAELLGVEVPEIRRLMSLGRLEFQQVCSGRCEILVSRDSVVALLPR